MNRRHEKGFVGSNLIPATLTNAMYPTQLHSLLALGCGTPWRKLNCGKGCRWAYVAGACIDDVVARTTCDDVVAASCLDDVVAAVT